MKEPISDVLTRKPAWVTAAKASLIGLTYSSSTTDDVIPIAQRAAFEACRQGNYPVAARALRNASTQSTDKRVQGWLLEQLAEATYPIDKDGSQKALAAGIAYKRIDTHGADQALQAKRYLKTEYTSLGNNLVIGINDILGDLSFREDGADAFEQALMDLGQHVGFLAQRPEKDNIGKLDVLWAIGHLNYVLFPCKSEATAEKISKSYADQVSGNMNWFRTEYDATCHPFPIIVHPSTVLDSDASPPQNMRVMGKIELDKLVQCARSFAIAVKDRVDDTDHVRASLSANHLLGTQFVDAFSIVPRRKR